VITAHALPHGPIFVLNTIGSHHHRPIAGSNSLITAEQPREGSNFGARIQKIGREI
jgi:hypothetical protein